MHYPERKIVSVSARGAYYEPARPFLAAEPQEAARLVPHADDDVLDLANLVGKRLIGTGLKPKIKIR